MYIYTHRQALSYYIHLYKKLEHQPDDDIPTTCYFRPVIHYVVNLHSKSIANQRTAAGTNEDKQIIKGAERENEREREREGERERGGERGGRERERERGERERGGRERGERERERERGGEREGEGGGGRERESERQIET